jgi:tetratricopeptide (TPR) repeat protein
MRLFLAVALILLLCAASFTRNTIFQNGVALWSDTAARSPLKARPHNNLGRAYLLAGGMQRWALPSFRRALELDPDYLDARFNLATTYYDLGLMADALREFSLIVEQYPSSGRAKFSRAMIERLASEGR